MKIGIISDTHDNMPKIAAAARVFNEEKVDLVLHAGDIISPITANEFSALKAPFIGVFGMLSCVSEMIPIFILSSREPSPPCR